MNLEVSVALGLTGLKETMMARQSTKIADKQRRVQEQVGKSDKKSSGGKQEAMRAGARRYPTPPFLKQHQPKPGDERVLDSPPMYDAPFYRGFGKLEGKMALLTGGAASAVRVPSCLPGRERTSQSST